MFIEAVTVCVNYSDFLAFTLPHNKAIFDKYIIVTSHEDYDTWKLCQYYRIKCIQTDLLKGVNEKGEKQFNKGAAINLGLDQLARKDFIVHLDGDIYLPPRTREMIEISKPNKDFIYGIDRLNCVGIENWVNFIGSPRLMHEKEIFVHMGAFPIGSRVVKTWREADFKEDLGYIPIGFFQMWNESNGVKRIYNSEHKSFSRSDSQFAQQWPRDKRGLIPEIVGIHLQTDKGDKPGPNWEGRTTKPFKLDKKTD